MDSLVPQTTLICDGKNFGPCLTALTVAHELGSIPFLRAALSVPETDFPIRLGDEVEAGVEHGGTVHPLFKGVCTALGFSTADGARRMTLEARDKAHAMTLGKPGPGPSRAINASTDPVLELEITAGDLAPDSGRKMPQGRILLPGPFEAHPGEGLEIKGFGEMAAGMTLVRGTRLEIARESCACEILFGPDFPAAGGENNSRKGWITVSGLGLLLNEEEKSITVATPGGQTLCLSDKDSSVTVKDANGNSLVMDKNGMAFKSKKDITLEAAHNITLKAGRDFRARGLSSEVEGQQQIKLSGRAMGELSSGGVLTVKGGLVRIN